MTIPTTSTQPRRTQVVRIWRQNRCLRSNTISVYLLWVQRFKAYCRGQKIKEVSQLTLAGVDTFATWYASKRGIDHSRALEGARSALRAWALALEVLGCSTPPWEPAPEPRSPCCPLLEEFEEHLARYRGNPPVTRKKKMAHIAVFLAFLRGRRRNMAELSLADIDAFIVACRHHYARTTVADMASSLRGFLRFLHITGRLAVDLAPSVMAPIVRRGERPLRALPWEKVQRILGAIDRSTAAGRRDYALLLLMSVYGLGPARCWACAWRTSTGTPAFCMSPDRRPAWRWTCRCCRPWPGCWWPTCAMGAHNMRARAVSSSACGHPMGPSALPRPCGTSCTNTLGLPVSRPLTSAAMCCATPMPAGNSIWGCRPKRSATSLATAVRNRPRRTCV